MFNTFKKSPAIGIVLALLVIGGGAYYLLGNQKAALQTEQAADNTNAQAQTSAHVSSSEFLTFFSPISGETVSDTAPVQVKWHLDDPKLVQVFPTANTFVVLHVISSSGQDIASIGQYPIGGGTSAAWDIGADLLKRLYTLTSGAQYKIRATLQYQPANFTCQTSAQKPSAGCIKVYSAADKALMTKAAQYKSESTWFIVRLNPPR